MGHPQVRWSVLLMTQNGGMPAQLQGDGEGVEALPLNWVECESREEAPYVRTACFEDVITVQSTTVMTGWPSGLHQRAAVTVDG